MGWPLILIHSLFFLLFPDKSQISDFICWESIKIKNNKQNDKKLFFIIKKDQKLILKIKLNF